MKIVLLIATVLGLVCVGQAAKSALRVNVMDAGNIQGNFWNTPNKFVIGKGERTDTIPVTFRKSFMTPPIVRLSILSLDVSNGANTRYSVKVKEVTKTGFTFTISTWGDTKLYSINVDWTAFGAA